MKPGLFLRIATLGALLLVYATEAACDEAPEVGAPKGDVPQGDVPQGDAPSAAAALRGQVDAIQRDIGSSTEGRRLDGLQRMASVIGKRPAAFARTLPKLREIFRIRGPEERRLAVGLLPRLHLADADALWRKRLDPAVESHGTVLAAAIDATRARATDHAFMQALIAAAMDDQSPGRRALLLECVGFADHPAVRVVLHRGAPGEHWVAAAGRALGLGKRRLPARVPPLLDLLEHENAAARVHAWESLWRVTGRAFPLDPKPWRAWWAERKDKAAPIALPVAGAGERYAADKPTHTPHYYTIPVPRPRSRVVFCLDVSQSMYGDGITHARRELTKTLLEFPSTHEFEIIAFNERVLPWTQRMERAHPVQKLRAITYLAQLETISYTNLFDAVETAFGWAGRGRLAKPNAKPLDMVFLLSDGAPNRGRFREASRVVREITALAKAPGRLIQVHTIGAGDEVFPLLRAIAKATGGSFVDAFE